MKKYNILIIACVVIIIVAGGFWYEKVRSQNQPNQIATGNEFFKLLDNNDNLVYSETLKLYPEAEAQYKQKLQEISALIAKGGDSDSMATNYNNYGVYNRYLGNYRESYNAFLSSLKLNSKWRITWLDLGDVLIKMKAYKSAEFAYNQATGLNPYDALNYVKLADLYNITGDKEKLAATFKVGLEKTKQNANQAQNVGLLHEYVNYLTAIKSYDQAILILEKLKTLEPANANALDNSITNINKLKAGK